MVLGKPHYLILFLIPFYHNTYGVEFSIFNLRESFSQLQAATNYNFGLNRYLQTLNSLCNLYMTRTSSSQFIRIFPLVGYVFQAFPHFL